jgi:4-methyl-5(b-hydroxyethyl)-thiazole monophosphate biosynthesis
MRVLLPLAEGFEEIEAVTIVDVLRRASIEVVTAALATNPVCGSHGITVLADTRLDDVLGAAFDAVVLPGGMPGSRILRDDARVLGVVREADRKNKLVAAVCAAPIVLEAAGVLAGRRATSYPGNELPSARYVEERVVVDGQLVTSRGPGTALEFALVLVEKLAGPDAAQSLRVGMIVATERSRNE